MYGSSHPSLVTPETGAMFARAALASAWRANGQGSFLTTLRSDGPLVLRASNPKGAEPLTHRDPHVARAALAAGTAGPIGGDRYHLDIRVGAQSTLVLNEISAMLVLPGPGGGRSKMSVTVTVEAGATFVWWPEQLIAAAQCNHSHDVRISLAADARLVMREEMLLGRHAEAPGDITSRLRVTREGRPLYDQTQAVGPSARGWNGAAVIGENRAVGSIILVDPGWQTDAPRAVAFDRNAVLSPLAGPGIAIGAVAKDSLDLRRVLTRGLTELGSPWAI